MSWIFLCLFFSVNSIFAQDLEEQIQILKDIIHTPGFLNEEEMQEFNTLWSEAEQQEEREYTKKYLGDIAVDDYSKTERAMLAFALLDQSQKTSIGKRAEENINKNILLKLRIKQLREAVVVENKLARTDERLAKEKEELAKAKEEGRKKDELIKALKKMNETIEEGMKNQKKKKK